MMRVAQFDSVNPSMAVGMGPWNFGSAQVEQVMLAAAQLHARLHPYIYSAAMDAYETGFPWTMAPLPLAFPNDQQVYGRENTAVRGYQWMFGPSLLACPLYGNDYATATARDVYLPAGKWMDYDTGEIHVGPKLLKDFALPVGKTPLFVGGKGVLVLRDLKDNSLRAAVYPIANNSIYRFTHKDGTTRTRITNANSSWDNLTVIDTTKNKPVAFEQEDKTGAIRFAITPGPPLRTEGSEVKSVFGLVLEMVSRREIELPVARCEKVPSGKTRSLGRHAATVMASLMAAGAMGRASAAETSDAGLTADQIEFFEKRIRPLLTDKCYKCHSAGAEKIKGGLLLDSRAGWFKGGDTGPALVPGKPNESLLIKAVRYTDQDLQMPPKEKLSAPANQKILKPGWRWARPTRASRQ
jgi:hypothetical protein